MAQHYDVVIVGSGAGGGTLAQRLAPTGKSILILERGEHLPREADNWSPKAVFVEQQVPHQGCVVRQSTASRSTPTPTTGSAAIPASTARR